MERQKQPEEWRTGQIITIHTKGASKCVKMTEELQYSIPYTKFCAH